MPVNTLDCNYPEFETNTFLKVNTYHADEKTGGQSKTPGIYDHKLEVNLSLKTNTDQADDRKADRFKANVELLSEKADSSSDFVYIPIDDYP